MAENRTALIGLSILGLTATITIALAQNTSNPMRSGNTTNPILSGNTVTQLPPVPVSPGPNLTILQPPLGRNAQTGLPCTGPLHWAGPDCGDGRFGHPSRHDRRSRCGSGTSEWGPSYTATDKRLRLIAVVLVLKGPPVRTSGPIGPEVARTSALAPSRIAAPLCRLRASPVRFAFQQARCSSRRAAPWPLFLGPDATFMRDNSKVRDDSDDHKDQDRPFHCLKAIFSPCMNVLPLS